MDSYAISRVGYGKKINEDSFGACFSADGRVAFFIVADGMGGHLAGDVAGKLSMNGVKDAAKEYVYSGAENLADFLRDTAVAVSKKVETEAENNSSEEGMGSTLVVLAVVEAENRAVICNVGDSRAYRYRGGKLKLLTKDHSIAQLMLDKGYTKEEIKRYLSKNSITKAMGFLSGAGPAGLPDIFEEDSAPGDIFLVCSDGLTSAADDYEIGAIFAENAQKSNETLCKELVRCALGYGSEDDITSLVVRL